MVPAVSGIRHEKWLWYGRFARAPARSREDFREVIAKFREDIREERLIVHRVPVWPVRAGYRARAQDVGPCGDIRSNFCQPVVLTQHNSVPCPWEGTHALNRPRGQGILHP